MENHPLWKGICHECMGFGSLGGSQKCGFCRGRGRKFRQVTHETEHLRRLNRVPKKPVGLATEIEGKTVKVVRPGSVAS